MFKCYYAYKINSISRWFIAVLCCFSGFLFVGDISGRIKLFKIEKNDTADEWLYSFVSDVWSDSDRIQVSKFIGLTNDDDSDVFFLIACKGSYIIAFAMQQDGTVTNKATQWVGSFCITGKFTVELSFDVDRNV